MGQFRHLPETIQLNNQEISGPVVEFIRKIIIKHFGSIQQEFGKCFEKFKQPTSTYNKQENMYLEFQVNNKFILMGNFLQL